MQPPELVALSVALGSAATALPHPPTHTLGNVATNVGRTAAASMEGAGVGPDESALEAQALSVKNWFASGSPAEATLRAAARKLFGNDMTKAVHGYQNFIREGHRKLAEDLQRSDESPKLLYMHNDIDDPSPAVLRAAFEVHV